MIGLTWRLCIILAVLGSTASFYLDYQIFRQWTFYPYLAFLGAVMLEVSKAGVIIFHRYFTKQRSMTLVSSIHWVALALKMNIFFFSWYLTTKFMMIRLSSALIQPPLASFEKFFFSLLMGLVIQSVIYVFCELFAYGTFEVFDSYHKLFLYKKRLGIQMKYESFKDEVNNTYFEKEVVKEKNGLVKKIKNLNGIFEKESIKL